MLILTIDIQYCRQNLILPEGIAHCKPWICISASLMSHYAIASDNT